MKERKKREQGRIITYNYDYENQSDSDDETSQTKPEDKQVEEMIDSTRKKNAISDKPAMNTAR